MKNPIKGTQDKVLKVKNLGGRPSLITEGQTIEIARVKGQYGILTWQDAIKLTKEIHPEWVLPHYKNCMIHINRLLPKLLEIVNQQLLENRENNLKKS